MLHCKSFSNKSFPVKSFSFSCRTPFCGILRSYGFCLWIFFHCLFSGGGTYGMDFFGFGPAFLICLRSFPAHGAARFSSGAVCKACAERIEYCREQSCCLTAWSDRLPSRTDASAHLTCIRLRFISTEAALFWQPTNRHFRLCRTPLPGRTARYFRCLPPVFLVSGIADPGDMLYLQNFEKRLATIEESLRHLPKERSGP